MTTTRFGSGWRRPRRPAFLLLLVGLAVLARLDAQYYYSTNKVQTRDYDFRSIQTTHFQVYFYSGGEVLADYAAKVAEGYWRAISSDLNITRNERIPILVYNSPNDFTETNVIDQVLEEGIGGFTEMYKNRVVVPYDGSFARFKKVLQHEITHVLEYELFYRPKLSNLLSLSEDYVIPLWVNEGFAEYMSGNVEIENESFMRDLVINNKLLPIEQLNDDYGYLSYREGEALFRYIDERYGRKKTFEFMHQLRRDQNVIAAFERTFGMSIRKFSAGFEKTLRRRFWPSVARDGNFEQVGRLLTDHATDGSVYNTAPALSPSGSMIAFISDRNDYTDVFVVSALDGSNLAHLVRGERSSGFESVHPYRAGMAWSPDETGIVLAGKSGGRDCLSFVEYPTGRVTRRWCPPLDGVFAPTFAPDGRKVAFVGLKDGNSDIYVYDLARNDMTRLTADIYEDRDPSFSPGGDSIVFVSDRPDSTPWQPGAYAVFSVSENSAVTRLTPRTGYLANPTLLTRQAQNPNPKPQAAAGSDRAGTPADTIHRGDTVATEGQPASAWAGQLLAFVSSDTSYDLCIYSLGEGRVIARTSFLGGVYYPSFSRSGDRLVMAYYENVGWDIATIRDPATAIRQGVGNGLKAFADTLSYERDEPTPDRIKPYKFVLTADYAAGAATFVGGSGWDGLAGTLYAAASDVPGNHRFYLQTDLYGDIANSQFSLEYWNMRNRLDFGAAVYQYFDYGYDWAADVIYGRRNLGLAALAAYPFDKYTRVEFGPSVGASQYEWYSPVPPRYDVYTVDSTAWKPHLALNGAFVFDNAWWGYGIAPERGTRARVEVDGSPLQDQQHVTLFADYRNYLKFAKRYVFANRLYGAASFGRQADRYYLGGETVRGYYYYEFFDRPGTNAVVLSSELRSPFVDRLKIAFPLPLDITDVRGVTFADWGVVWNNGKLPWLYDFENMSLQDLKLGVGVGIRFQISWFAIKLDYGWPISALSTDSPGHERTRSGTWYFSLGTDF